jgi:hypothetical protein
VPVCIEESGWVSIIYSIEDDFKKLAEDELPLRRLFGGLTPEPTGGHMGTAHTLRDTATFLNDTFLSWMEEKGISPIVLWEDNEPHDLWNAKLFPVSTNPAESMRISLSLQRNWEGWEQSTSAFRRWRESPRMSLQEILESVDYERFLNNYSILLKKVNLESLATILTPKSNLSSEEILSWCVEADDYATAVRMTLALIEQSNDILFQARLYKLLSNITKKAGTRN